MSKKTIWKSAELFTDEEVKDFLEGMNEGLGEEDEPYTEEDIYEVNNDYFDDDFGERGNIKYSPLKNTPCVVSGVLGLWDGKHEIIPKQFESIEDAIYSCLEDTNEIYEDENGDLNIVAHHHDGTNNFKIKHVNGEPIKFCENC